MRTALTLTLLAAAMAGVRAQTDAFGAFFAVHAAAFGFYLFGLARIGHLQPGGADLAPADRATGLRAFLYGTFITVGNNAVNLLAPYREAEVPIDPPARAVVALVLLLFWAGLVLVVWQAVGRRERADGAADEQ